MSATITLDEIKARCDEVADCWIWRGATSHHGYPIMKNPGSRLCVFVRRMVAELKGTPPAPRQPVVTTCNERCCCNPAHIRLSTIKKVAQAAAKSGAYSKPSRCAKIAASRRASPTAKLNEGAALEIRLSDKTARELAAEYGVNISHIKAIRQGKAWKDYSSPFAGLGARVRQGRAAA